MFAYNYGNARAGVWSRKEKVSMGTSLLSAVEEDEKT